VYHQLINTTVRQAIVLIRSTFQQLIVQTVHFVGECETGLSVSLYKSTLKHLVLTPLVH